MKSECGQEPPSTLVRPQAHADDPHSASEGDKELVQDEFTPTGSKNWRVVSCTVVDSLAKLVLYERRPVFAETLAVGVAGVASPVHS